LPEFVTWISPALGCAERGFFFALRHPTQTQAAREQRWNSRAIENILRMDAQSA
jgi:hypothetical protein